MPSLRKRAIDAKEAVAAEVVAAACFAGIGLAPGISAGDCALQRGWIGKRGRRSVRVEVTVHLDGACLHHIAAEVPVGRPANTILNAEGQPAGPARQAEPLPK